MKKTAVTVVAIAAFGIITYAQDNAPARPAPSGDKPANAPQMPPMQKSEMIEAQVVKVYSAVDDGAKFKAYVIKYKDSEVVVMDPMGTSDKKQGETIKVAVMRMEMPGRGKMIRFMLAEAMAGMQGMRRPGSNEAAPKASGSDDVPLKVPEAPQPDAGK